ncbi:MAG TPA: hypothetical protein VFK80_07890 [Limnochordia bacterium]|nr:hypothetical protein [Limnochordia bacterium]
MDHGSEEPLTGSTTQRLGGACTIVGTLLFAAASVLHPPTFDPQAVGPAMREIQGDPLWVPVHVALTAAALLWGLGLLALHERLVRTGRAGASPFAAGALLIGTTLWILAFLTEAAGGPALARAYQAGAVSPAIANLVALCWDATLALGYGAAFLYGVALLLWGVDLRRARFAPGWLAWLGILAGGTTAVTQPLIWAFPKAAYLVLAAPSAGLVVWSVLVGWRLQRRI